MTDYKMLILDEKEILKVTDSLAADEDRLAKARARSWTDAGFIVELWQGARQVEAPPQAWEVLGTTERQSG